jgi:transposase-like protein
LLSYRDLEEMMAERGLCIDHTTIYRWVQHYAPELEKRCRPHLKACNDSWKVDETYIKVKNVWMYLYRAVDSDGNTLEFLLSPTRDAESAKRFFVKALASKVKYLNNLIEQDHRFIKRLTKPGMGFFSFETARQTLQGFEIMNMLRKGQIQGVDKGDVQGQAALVARLFGVVA